jgi:hypothetical protein
LSSLSTFAVRKGGAWRFGFTIIGPEDNRINSSTENA